MRYRYTTSIFTAIFIIAISALSIITKDKNISDVEGRTLEAIPLSNISVGQVLKGEYFQRWDRYFSDHLYGRDNMVQQYMSLQEMLQKKYINEVYIGKDNFLFGESSFMLDEDDIRSRSDYFNKFAEKYKDKKIYLVNVPNKSSIYPEKFPIESYKSSESYYMDKFIKNIDNNIIDVIDLNNVLSKNKDKSLYYKTDHHWTMEGSYLGYKTIINEMNNDYEQIGYAQDKSNYNIETYNEIFLGSNGRKIGYITDTMEDIQVYNDKNIEEYKAYYNNEEYPLIYKEKLSNDKFNDDYSVYIGGSKSELVVENNSSGNDLSIMIIGDSMDNTLIPLFSHHFNKIWSIDLRYYTEMDINNKIEIDNPDIIMLIGTPIGYLDSNEWVFRIN